MRGGERPERHPACGPGSKCMSMNDRTPGSTICFRLSGPFIHRCQIRMGDTEAAPCAHVGFLSVYLEGISRYRICLSFFSIQPIAEFYPILVKV